MHLIQVAVGSLVILASLARADTITVCGSGCDHTSIQAAIDAASTGDTIRIGSGLYIESLEIYGKSVNLEAVEGQSVVVDGGGTQRCLSITAASDPTMIRGLNFQNGVATDEGGGVRIDDSNVTIVACVVQQCLSDRGIGCAWCQGNRVRGGGIAVLGSSAVSILDTEVSECKVRISFYAWGANGQSRGGGLYVEDSVVQVQDCIFRSNEAIARDYPPNCPNCNWPTTAVGGGICVASGGDVTVVRTIIQEGMLHGDNASYGLGAGLACMGGTLAIENSVISSNASSIPDNCYCGPEKNQGGGIYVGEAGSVSLVSSAIEANVVSGASISEGGATYNEDGLFTIQSSRMCGNSSGQVVGRIVDSGGNCIADACCPGDIDCDQAVGASDLGRILTAWNTFDAVVDQDADGVVGGRDLAYILSYWGSSCP